MAWDIATLEFYHHLKAHSLLSSSVFSQQLLLPLTKISLLATPVLVSQIARSLVILLLLCILYPIAILPSDSDSLILSHPTAPTFVWGLTYPDLKICVTSWLHSVHLPSQHAHDTTHIVCFWLTLLKHSPYPPTVSQKEPLLFFLSLHQPVATCHG